MFNRLENVRNRYQTSAKKVLCLCSAGLLRSPTAANVLHQEYGYNTRAAGVAREYALIPVDEVLLSWADEIVCVSAEVLGELMLRHNLDKYSATVIALDIPDRFEWNDPELKRIIKEQYVEEALGV